MELMEVYHEALATRIIARVTNGKCEGAEFVFGLIESAIRKEATEILLIPVQELDMVRMDFGRPHCYYRQPDINRAQFAYLAIYLVLIGNVASEKASTERLFRGSDGRLYNLQFGRMRLPDNEPAVIVYIEPE
jgi:predicted metal-binding protein